MNLKNNLLRPCLALCWCLLVPATIWAVAALYFDVRIASLQVPLALAYGGVMLAVWLGGRHPWKITITAASFAVVLGWWLSLKPAGVGDWQADVAVPPHADIAGNTVTLHAIRNCDYRTETDYDVRRYDRVFDLERLRTVDLFLVYWGSPNIAHTMVSFGFDDGAHVCVSIETRKKNGQGYSALRGLFRQFELAYVVADERDVVRLRTNYRQGEDVYLYRLRATPAQARTLFLDYLRRANQLHENPEWYNALTGNCTTAIRTQRAAADRAPWDWRMLVNGHLDELFYERGLLDTRLPFAELKRLGHINEKARAADQAADFSQRIRENVPAPVQ